MHTVYREYSVYGALYVENVRSMLAAGHKALYHGANGAAAAVLGGCGGCPAGFFLGGDFAGALGFLTASFLFV